MSLLMNPGVATDGLVFYYDMGNTTKSYLGEPTTNQFAIPTPDSNGYVSFSVNGTGTFRRIYSGTYGGYTIQPTDIVYRYDLGTNGCHYHGNDVTITAGQYPTFTFDYYLSPDVTSFNDTFMANFENLGSGVGGSAGLPNYYKGIWQTIQINGNQASATSGLRMLLYPGGCSGGRLAATGYILMKNPQVTFNSTSGKVLPFVAGTRSNTQAILDLTNNKTITAHSLTYNTNNTFSFTSASANYAEIGAITLTNSSYTVEAWIKRSSTGSTHGILSDLQYGWWAFYISSGNKVVMYHQRNSPSFAANEVVGLTNIGTNWTHVVGMFNTSVGMSVFVNGVLDNSNSSTVLFDLAAGRGPQFVGLAKFDAANVLTNPFDGQIASIKVYNRAITSAEVQQNFNALRGRFGL